jgi:hypothetical protein
MSKVRSIMAGKEGIDRERREALMRAFASIPHRRCWPCSCRLKFGFDLLS